MTRTSSPSLPEAGGRAWGYGPQNGPTRWSTLDPAYRMCGLGREQSPIDLTGGRASDLTPVAFDYRRTRATIENTGWTIQVNPARGSGLTLEGTRYGLQQLHFHRGSEHTRDGVRLPLEMHLVHEDETGAVAVVGVLFEEGAANEALAPIWAALPSTPGAPRPVPGELDLAALLPKRRTTWRYRGSLTTPPCSEGVAWIILTDPLPVAPQQLAAFGAIHPHNFRPVQPLGERTLRVG